MRRTHPTLAIADSLDEEVDETAYQRSEIQRIFDLIARDSVSPQERVRMKDEYSLEPLQQDKFEKGKTVGKKEGLKKGQQQKALEIAHSLLAKGIEPAIVSETTGLSPDDLAALSS